MKQLYTFLAILFLFLARQSNGQILFTENFDYPAGDSIGAHGWVWNTGTTNTIMVVSPGLNFPSYPLSGIGNSCRLRNNGNDAYKPFTTADSVGNLYVSFMVNVDSAQANGGDYFFALLPSNSTTIYISRFFTKDTLNGISFGVSKGAVSASNPSVWATGTYERHVTYLAVIKYTFNTGSTTDDEIRVYIFNTPIPGVEPSTPTIGPVTGTSTDPVNLGRVAIRQGSSSVAPTLNIDGIRVAKTWGGITSVNSISTGTPLAFSLSQNYPNPFNPTTNIKFSIPNASYVNIKVFDMLGREAADLVNENLNAGEYSTSFDASSLSSGVYVYRIAATVNGTKETFSESKSMVLIK